MQLPAGLRQAIERETALVPHLRDAAKAMSDAYRAGRPPRLDSEAACAAYAATRLPATYAAAHRVLAQISGDLRTVTDLGSGAGAASCAAATLFPAATLTLVEQNPRLLDWSRRLGHPEWTRTPGDLASIAPPEADLILFCYSLGELRDPLSALDRAWRAARRFLVVIEPGTKPGFATVHRVREHLLPHVTAPCPHRAPCPMLAAGDWCHFAARVERTALHRRLKDAELAYEDEKFSYLILDKQPPGNSPPRIVRHPQHRPGLVQLTLCSSEGLATSRVTKRDGDRWRQARKAEWGDAWPGLPPGVR